jgi:hypothetical protein
LILNAHSQIAIPEEATFLIPLLKRKLLCSPIKGEHLRNLIRYLSFNPQFRLWNYDSNGAFSTLSQRKKISFKELIDILFTSYCRSQGKQIWGDKTPSFFRKIDILYFLFPEARFIHIVRDGRDVFDSWRRIDPSKDNAAVVALDWRYKLSRIVKSLQKMPSANSIEIRYEDLLEQPEATIESLCSHIGVRYDSGLTDFYKTSHLFIGDHHSNLIFNPIDKSNKAKWKKTLSVKEVQTFNVLAGRYLRKYNYEVPSGSFGISALLNISRSLSLGMPGRVYQILYTKMVLEHSARKGRPTDSLKTGNMPKSATGFNRNQGVP